VSEKLYLIAVEQTILTLSVKVGIYRAKRKTGIDTFLRKLLRNNTDGEQSFPLIQHKRHGSFYTTKLMEPPKFCFVQTSS